jgi:hypothetical protein
MLWDVCETCMFFVALWVVAFDSVPVAEPIRHNDGAVGRKSPVRGLAKREPVPPASTEPTMEAEAAATVARRDDFESTAASTT